MCKNPCEKNLWAFPNKKHHPNNWHVVKLVNCEINLKRKKKHPLFRMKFIVEIVKREHLIGKRKESECDKRNCFVRLTRNALATAVIVKWTKYKIKREKNCVSVWEFDYYYKFFFHFVLLIHFPIIYWVEPKRRRKKNQNIQHTKGNKNTTKKTQNKLEK